MAPILSRVSSNFGFGKRTAAAATAPAPGIEDVFQTYLYTGNGSTQTITNEIDLSGEGGLVWIKLRATGGSGNYPGNQLFNTVRGSTKSLKSDSTAAEATYPDGYGLNSFNANGFTVKDVSDLGYGVNESSATYASWTFRKAAKFFDVVTYTGTGSDQTISHNLGSTPGCIIVKRTDSTNDWYVYHRSLATATENWIRLNNTGAANGAIGQDLWGPPTSTTFKVDTYLGLSTSSATYVAYLFAHDAGGFGDSGNDNVVSCGSFTTDGSANATVDLGWEPQWVLVKSIDNVDSWFILDNMRGWVTGGNDARLLPNSANAEQTGSNYGNITATGFVANGAYYANSTHIYIAIRRGPMKTPTDATKVFSAAITSNDNNYTTTNFPVDFAIAQSKLGSLGYGALVSSRLTNRFLLKAYNTDAEASLYPENTWQSNTGVRLGFYSSGYDIAQWTFRRAPGFFDVVAYTGTGSATTVSHNLGVAPELMIVKWRTGATGGGWAVYSSALGAGQGIFLNGDGAAAASGGTLWNSTAPTNSVFTVGTNSLSSNNSGGTYIAYLFASCPGVSKVFNYTGTGTTKQIDCGFTNGARFVLIKRTDSTGDWYVWDSARGIISGNDPYLLLNSTAAEVTNTDYIDPYSAGFEISSTAPAAINANGGSYIGLAIA